MSQGLLDHPQVYAALTRVKAPYLGFGIRLKRIELLNPISDKDDILIGIVDTISNVRVGLYTDGGRCVQMAEPIEPTPTLKGKSVDKFCRSIKEAQYDPEKDKYLREARELSKRLHERYQPFPLPSKPKDA